MATNREVFNGIAQSWYGFRHHTRFKNELNEMAARWGKGKLLNVGCGHGPDFIPFKDKFELTGVDFSLEMIKLAERYANKFSFEANLMAADAQYLPCKNGAFDWAIAVASYHHIKGREKRALAFQELRRVLKNGSEIFITVWNRWQPIFWFKGEDAYVPWKSKKIELNRYYYLYTYPEIKQMLSRAGFAVLRTYPEYSYRLPCKLFSKNICVLARAV